MARIAGINIPVDKRVIISLTYIKGIGSQLAARICDATKIDASTRVRSLTDDQVRLLRDEINNNYTVEGELESRVRSDIKKLVDMGCYRGRRHRMKLPVRGQRTSTNARTRKGKAIAIAGKKK